MKSCGCNTGLKFQSTIIMGKSFPIIINSSQYGWMGTLRMVRALLLFGNSGAVPMVQVDLQCTTTRGPQEYQRGTSNIMLSFLLQTKGDGWK
ncbi:hypothetical protein C7H08_15295 [Marinobacter halophilus]|uniref:Uncharacterized protein n=1 Tax=Marinobacter halophilus TaxID=1323740 RepID=A0A2T1K8J6_9GAMM|nr:hypothetical protein C7H08_15295 [Marinobacter halophilus]